jgi:hypothetical protein
VELLPQSKAATVSVTDVFNRQLGQVHFARDEFTNGITGSDEIVGQMGVQALHAFTRASDTAAGLWAVGALGGEAAPRGVLFVRSLQRVGVDEVFESVDSPVALYSTHGIVEIWIDQPEECRHRRGITKVRFVFDDDRTTVESSHDDGAASRERSTKVLLDDGNIGGRRVAETQRQNSRVRTRREKNAFADEWCFDIVGEFAATNDETDDGETRGCSPGSPVL